MITLQKNPQRDFVILNITDPQLDDNYLDQNNVDRQFLFHTIEEAIAEAKPDLITVSGDLGYGDAPAYLSLCRCFADFIEAHQIPWAVVWGNHDNQGGKERIQQAVKLFEEYPHFVYESGDESLGNGNYVISIAENGAIIEGILMMDSHNRLPYVDETGETVNAWAKLLPPQLAWYEQQIQALRDAGCENTVLITHIPIYAYRQAAAEAFPENSDPKNRTVPESYTDLCWNPGYKDSFGVQYEKICSYPEDEGAFDIIRKLNSTKVILCGHDHINCWSIRYQGVRLTYSLKTGRGCYYHKDLNGGTVLRIHSDGDVNVSHIFIPSEE